MDRHVSMERIIHEYKSVDPIVAARTDEVRNHTATVLRERDLKPVKVRRGHGAP